MRTNVLETPAGDGDFDRWAASLALRQAMQDAVPGTLPEVFPTPGSNDNNADFAPPLTTSAETPRILDFDTLSRLGSIADSTLMQPPSLN